MDWLEYNKIHVPKMFTKEINLRSLYVQSLTILFCIAIVPLLFVMVIIFALSHWEKISDISIQYSTDHHYTKIAPVIDEGWKYEPTKPWATVIGRDE